METKCARYGFDTVLGCCKDSNLFLAHIVRVVCLRNWFGQSVCPIHDIGVGTRGSRLLARVPKEMLVTERDIAYEAELTILKTATSGLTVKISRERYNRFSGVLERGIIRKCIELSSFVTTKGAFYRLLMR